MKHVTLAVALALAAGFASAQNATSGLAVTPGMSGESSGTVTGAGSGRDGLFGTPSDSNETAAARGSTGSGAKGSGTVRNNPRAGRGTGNGTDKRGSGGDGADPR